MRRLALFAVMVGVVGCGSPTTPTPTPASSTGTVVVNGWLLPLAVGQSVQLSATAISSDGASRSVTNEATWATSNTVVAIVSPSGLVTAQGVGPVEIRATYDNKTGALPLAVEGPVPPSAPIPGLVCGVERWAVKTLSDVDAGRVDLAHVQPTTIKALNERAAHCNGGPDSRVYPEELELFEVTGRITVVRFEDDRDYHIAVADPADSSYTMVTEVADIACQGAISSPHRTLLEAGRNMFISLLGGRVPSSLVGVTVRLRGVGFFDFNHAQTGRSRNCMEIHPVLAISTVQ